MQLYVGPCHEVSVEIAVVMVVPIENPADCDVRSVIRFLQADAILGYPAEEASSRVELFCCTSAYCLADTSLAAWAIPLGHLRVSSVQSGPGTIGLIPVSKMQHLAGKRFANDDLKDVVVAWLNNQAAIWYKEGIYKLMPRYDKYLNVKGDYVER